MIFEFFQHHLIAITIVAFMIMFIVTNNNFDKRTNRCFLSAISCVMILVIEEGIESHLALEPVYMEARVPLSALGYTLRPMIPFFLILTVKLLTKGRTALMSIPLIINGLVSFSALFSKAAFSYSPTNEFIRGPLGFTPFVVAFLYVLILQVFTIQACRNGSLTEAMIVSAIVLLAFVSTLLESILHFRFVQNASMATSITFYYLFLQSLHSNRDPLTGALVRRRFYLDAEKHQTTLTAIISLDVNDLKEINDAKGHIAGDKALIAVTDVVKRHTGTQVTLYRVGGDEFMLLCNKLDEISVLDLIIKIQTDMEKTEYSCAIGHSMYTYPMKLDDACHIADNIMYQNKRKMKKLPPSDKGYRPSKPLAR